MDLVSGIFIKLRRWRFGLIAALLACSMYVLCLANASIIKTEVVLAGENIFSDLKPYVYRAHYDGPGHIRFDIRYVRGQNAVMRVYAGEGCITGLAVLTDAMDAPVTVPLPHSLCGHFGRPDIGGEKPTYITVDFAPYFSPGINHVMMDVTSDKRAVRVDVSPVLLGAYGLSSAACGGLLLGYSLLVYASARRFALNKATAWIAAIGAAYLSSWLYLRPDWFYTPDFRQHAEYTEYLMASWFTPYAFYNGESHQPPLYYLLSAALCGFFNGMAFPFSVHAVMRCISLVCYTVFYLYGLRTLALVLPRRDMAYYAGCVMIVFWPLASMTATNISNDLGLYAAWGAGFFYLLRWYQSPRAGDLARVIFCMGLCLAIKTSGIIFCAIVGACALAALYRRRIGMGDVLNRQLLPAYGFCAFGLLVNTGKMLLYYLAHRTDGAPIYLGSVSNHVYPWSYYVFFDVAGFIREPYALFLFEKSFWNYYLKTFLYMPWWKHQLSPLSGQALNLLFLSMIAGTLIIHAHAAARKLRMTLAVPLWGAVLLSTLGILIYMLTVHYEFAMSFRFVLASLVPMVILYCQGAQYSRGLSPWLYRAFCLAGGLFALLGAFHYVHTRLLS